MNRWLVIRPRWLPIAWRLRLRVPLVWLILAILILGFLILNFAIGELFVPLNAVIPTIWNSITGDVAAQAAHFGGSLGRRYTFVIAYLLMPRLFVALLVGFALAVSGSVLQGLTRNPLASPDVIGLSQGANLAAIAVLVFAGSLPFQFIPPIAFLGGSLAALVVYFLAWKGGRSSPVRLVLVGVGISAVSYALIQVVISSSLLVLVSQALGWLVGSVYGRTWVHFWGLFPWVAIATPIVLVLSRHLDVFYLGEDIARGLGMRIEWQRGLLLLASVALAGSAVATAGTVGFVALIAPHMARLLVGPSHGGSIPVSGLLGALIVLIADTIGRLLMPPIDIPCGVITVIVGAPYFIWLLLKSENL